MVTRSPSTSADPSGFRAPPLGNLNPDALIVPASPQLQLELLARTDLRQACRHGLDVAYRNPIDGLKQIPWHQSRGLSWRVRFNAGHRRYAASRIQPQRLKPQAQIGSGQIAVTLHRRDDAFDGRGRDAEQRIARSGYQHRLSSPVE